MELVEKFVFSLLALIVFCAFASMFITQATTQENMNKRLNNFFGFIICTIGLVVSLVMVLHYAGFPKMHITP